MAATMGYMHRQRSRRLEPNTILDGATRAIVVSRNHYTADATPDRERGHVAKYARGRDYHNVLAAPLERLTEFVRSHGDAGTVARWFVDAGPVPERELAQRAGLGWIGKNTMLIDPKHGSFIFLASVLTNLDITVDPPYEADRCGTCRRCLDVCPTAAFPSPRVLDSRHCISYLTIEHRGEISHDLQPRMQNWVFGCDLCQDVCPWNHKFATAAADLTLELDAALEHLDLAELIDQSDKEFAVRYGWTPLERPGPEGLRRNAHIAAANANRT